MINRLKEKLGINANERVCKRNSQSIKYVLSDVILELYIEKILNLGYKIKQESESFKETDGKNLLISVYDKSNLDVAVCECRIYSFNKENICHWQLQENYRFLKNLYQRSKELLDLIKPLCTDSSQKKK